MDALGDLLDKIKKQGLAQGHFLGLLHIIIGRRIGLADGTPISAGVTWRNMAAHLKKVRWSKEAVRELGLHEEIQPPRDRGKLWYAVIVQAGVDSAAAIASGDRLAEKLKAIGYIVGPAPGQEPIS
jgi:hypothetical protein